MKLRALASEAARDVGSGTSRTVSLWLMLTVILLGLSVADTVTVEQILRSARAFRDGGAATQIISAAGAIDGSACDALTSVPGVQAAGALRPGNRDLTLVLLPGTPVPSFEVSASFPAVLHARPSAPAGVYVPDELLRATGETIGQSNLQTSRGRLPVAGSYAYPSDGRRAGLGWAALIPAEAASPDTASASAASPDSRKPFDECWVTTWPQLPGINQLLMNTLDPDQAAGFDIGSIRVSQFNAHLGYTFAGAHQYRHRATRFAPAAAALAGLLLAVVALRTRRIELAARLHDGARRAELQWMLLAETSSWAVPAAVTTIGAGVLLAARAGPPDHDHLLGSITAVAVAGQLGAILGSLATVSRIRESQLFRYFKDR